MPHASWPLWRRILFRFFFIYLGLHIAPWTWLDRIPGVSVVTKFYYTAMDWAVNFSNGHLFHVREELVPLNGSGDTSYGWAQVDLFLVLAAAGTLIWSVVQRHRKEYVRLNYWLCLFLRYFLALNAFGYGILKLFALQMPFPNTSMLATPLGDLLPMRLSWMFIGYSAPYQIFSGVMEVLVGVLLLYRRTVTLGVILATAVFTNVMVLNLAYDIPVKIFSMHLVLMCFFLLANEFNRIACFFFLNKPAEACTIYHVSYASRPMRIGRIIFKTLFILLAVGWTFYDYFDWYRDVNTVKAATPFQRGMYDVSVFTRNGDTLPPLLTDTLRWQDLIVDGSTRGSIRTADTSFKKIYNRAYFAFTADTKQRTVSFSNFSNRVVGQFWYEVPDSNTVILRGTHNRDSLYVVLRRSPRHFQLAEKQFHWLSEYNR